MSDARKVLVSRYLLTAAMGGPGSGRKSELTPELGKQIIGALQNGLYIEQAAGAYGVDRTTVYGWLKRGRQAKEGVLADFYQGVTSALEKYELLMLGRLNQLAREGDSQSIRWILERRFPHRWGNRQQVEVSGKVDNVIPLAIIRAAAESAEEERVLAKAARIAAGEKA